MFGLMLDGEPDYHNTTELQEAISSVLIRYDDIFSQATIPENAKLDLDRLVTIVGGE